MGLRVGGFVVADPERVDRAFWLLRWAGDEELPPVVIRIGLVGAELRIGEEHRESGAYSDGAMSCIMKLVRVGSRVS
jgi:hypothetical protein